MIRMSRSLKPFAKLLLVDYNSAYPEFGVGDEFQQISVKRLSCRILPKTPETLAPVDDVVTV